LTHYLIENRIYGFAKQYARSLIWHIAKKFKVRGRIRQRPVPHMSLVGGFEAHKINEVISKMKDVCMHYDPIPLQIKGIDFMTSKDGYKVMYLNVTAPEALKKLRWELIEQIRPYAKLKWHDKKKDTVFHITIAFKDIDKKYREIKRYVKNLETVEINTTMFRITLIQKQRIKYEYDLLEKRLLTRRQALDRGRFRRTIHKLPEETVTIFLNKKNLDRTYITADLHLNHKNIIQYCNRPFSSVREMNRQLVKNWNKTIGRDDMVLYLGDLAFGKGKNKVKYWLNQLNGRVYFIRGNHDNNIPNFVPHIDKCKLLYEDKAYLVNKKQKTFLLAHRPERPQDWDGWIIHGHEHNNNPEKYPFINRENKTINVSTELTGYRPIPLESLIPKLG